MVGDLPDPLLFGFTSENETLLAKKENLLVLDDQTTLLVSPDDVQFGMSEESRQHCI